MSDPWLGAAAGTARLVRKIGCPELTPATALLGAADEVRLRRDPASGQVEATSVVVVLVRDVVAEDEAERRRLGRDAERAAGVHPGWAAPGAPLGRSHRRAGG